MRAVSSMNTSFCSWVSLTWFGLMVWCLPLQADTESEISETSFFVAQVAPILEAHCLKCHYPGNEKGDLSLASFESVQASGILESPSRLLEVIQPIGMTPPEMPKKAPPLSRKDQQIILTWVNAGASWPEGLLLRPAKLAKGTAWAFEPLSQAEPPSSTQPPEATSLHPIDRFLMQSLAEKGLSMSPPANRSVLARRVHYDLTGLPPSPEALARFEQDPDPRAWEKLIDELLNSPAYGERWGRHWLDVIRFGESRGYERNEIILNAWPFRDYVIDSFNADKPLDRLITEHLAGDQLAPDDPEVSVGTTFLVCGPYDDVGNQDPAQAAQIRANTIDEIIRATSEAFLGLTVGCSRCHDHKFDPITQEDYYRWYATFRGVRHGSREIASSDQRAAYQEKIEPLRASKESLQSELKELKASILARAEQRSEVIAAGWMRPPIRRTGIEETFTPTLARYVRLVVEGTESHPERNRGYGIDEFEVWNSDAPSRNVALLSEGSLASGESRVAEDFAEAYSANLTIDGRFGARWIAQGPTLTLTLKEPTLIHRIFFSSDRVGDAGDHSVANFVCEYRLEFSLDGVQWQELAHSRDRLPMHQAHRDHRWLMAEASVEETASIARINQAIARVNEQIASIPALPQWWVGRFDAIEETTHLFLGGDPQRKAQPTQPASLSALDRILPPYALDHQAPEAQRRLALASWLTHPENPLTARVWANRVWQHHFGRGLVATPSDFGAMGEPPTHPELLDWLAQRLMAYGWRLKPFHKMILLSQAYQQQSGFRDEPAGIDSENTLLWRFSPRRLSAEEIRDTMLSSAGLLDQRMGGQGFRLYRYLQDNVATYVPLDQHGPSTWRRAVYHHQARASVVDLMSEFDCPDPAFASPRRATTTTPLQALTLMNHTFTMDMASAMAQRLDREAGSNLTHWIQRAFLMTQGRLPDAEEIKKVASFKQAMGGQLVCRALFNANAFIHLD